MDELQTGVIIGPDDYTATVHVAADPHVSDDMWIMSQRTFTASAETRRQAYEGVDERLTALIKRLNERLDRLKAAKARVLEEIARG